MGFECVHKITPNDLNFGFNPKRRPRGRNHHHGISIVGGFSKLIANADAEGSALVRSKLQSEDKDTEDNDENRGLNDRMLRVF
ncbi:unnamed protein product [Prunus armeniaca]|uniref:Uncharacterized protein n=1 Tax=Prunus armeniaca TaxID=36596 RepID=A0A6J5UN28_PRUAR|nr:unnamed protein product [Prunus armeniaca]